MKMFYLFLIVVTFFNCYRTDFFQANHEFMPYVLQFKEEGAKRGQNIHLEKNGLIIEFGALPKEKAGKCRPKDYPKIITINEKMWKSLDSFQKRALIFHELGHCVLFRKHNNHLLPRGECASLLAGKEDGFQCSQNLYSSIWWTYYLDELFDETVKIPAWYNKQFSYRQKFQKQYLINQNNPTFKIDPTVHIETIKKHYKSSVGIRGIWSFLDIDTSKNFQIEIIYTVIENYNKGYYLQWNDISFTVHPNSLSILTQRKNIQQVRRKIRTLFYEKKLPHKDFIKKLTIRKLDQLLYFFYNENLLHIIEIAYPKGKGNYFVNQTNKNMVKTNFLYKKEAELKVEIAYLE